MYRKYLVSYPFLVVLISQKINFNFPVNGRFLLKKYYLAKFAAVKVNFFASFIKKQLKKLTVFFDLM